MGTFNENWDGISHNRLDHLEEATQQVIGKYRFTPFVEMSMRGWKLSVQGIGEIGFIEEPAKKNTKTSVAPYRLYYFKMKGGVKINEFNVEPDLMAFFYPANETRIVDAKNVRYAPRQLLKSVALWMDKHGYRMIDLGEEKVESQSHAETVSEAANLGDHWTDLDKMAENIRKESKNVQWTGKFDAYSYLLQIAGSLKIKHGQQRDFLDGLRMHLEGVHRKLRSPSKHGNIEIMHDLAKIMLELNKY